MKKASFKPLSGFTLIELLITVAIITVAVGAGMVKVGGFEAKRQVLEQANKLASDLRWARSGAQKG